MALNPMLKKLVTQSASKYSGVSAKAAKPKEGRNTYRIIAPAPGSVPWVGEDGVFFREVGVHWIKADENGKPLAVVGSEEICYQRPSAVAAAIDMAIASAYDEETKKLYGDWKARKSIIVNVKDRSTRQVEVLELTPTTLAKIMELANLYDDQSGVDIFDHANGMDIVITKSGKGLNTNYDVAVVPLAPGKTFDPITDEDVRQTTNLDDWIASNYFRGEEQKALNAIAQITGLAVPQLSGPATPTQALTSSAASVAAALPAATPAAVVTPAAPAPAAAAPAATPAAPATAGGMTMEQMQAAMAQMQAQMLAQQASAAPAAAAAPAVTPDTSISDLSTDEQDALLAELNGIGA